MIEGIVNDWAEVNHECANEGGDVHAQILVELYLRVAYTHRQVVQAIFVVQVVVVVDLLRNLVRGCEQTDYFVTLGWTVGLLHYAATGRTRQVVEYCMSREE